MTLGISLHTEDTAATTWSGGICSRSLLLVARSRAMPVCVCITDRHLLCGSCIAWATTTPTDCDFIAETTHQLHLEAPKHCVAIMPEFPNGYCLLERTVAAS